MIVVNLVVDLIENIFFLLHNHHQNLRNNKKMVRKKNRYWLSSSSSLSSTRFFPNEDCPLYYFCDNLTKKKHRPHTHISWSISSDDNPKKNKPNLILNIFFFNRNFVSSKIHHHHQCFGLIFRWIIIIIIIVDGFYCWFVCMCGFNVYTNTHTDSNINKHTKQFWISYDQPKKKHFCWWWWWRYYALLLLYIIYQRQN